MRLHEVILTTRRTFAATRRTPRVSVLRVASVFAMKVRGLGHLCWILRGGASVELHPDSRRGREREARSFKLETAFENVRQHRRRGEDNLLGARIVASEIEMK